MVLLPVKFSCDYARIVSAYFLNTVLSGIAFSLRGSLFYSDISDYSASIIMSVDGTAVRIFIFWYINKNKEKITWGLFGHGWEQIKQKLRRASQNAATTQPLLSMLGALHRLQAGCRWLATFTTSLSTPSKRIILIANVKQTAIIVTVLMGYAWTADKTLEAVVFVVSFNYLRYKHTNIYHAKSTLGCTVFTCVCGCLCIAFAAPIETSLMATVVVGFIAAWVGDMAARLEKKRPEDFAKYGLSPMMQNFAYDWLVRKMSGKDLMEVHQIDSIETVKTRKYRIKQQMNSK